MKTVYLSLGSNVGERQTNLAQARERLATGDTRLLRASAIYETEPRDFIDQDWFLNQVVEIETSLSPEQLLALLRSIELALGRVPTHPNGPRVIDMDILFYADAIVSTPGLEIPHPRLSGRRFVLEPLAELAPDLRHPRTNVTVREMLAQVHDQSVQRL